MEVRVTFPTGDVVYSPIFGESDLDDGIQEARREFLQRNNIFTGHCPCCGAPLSQADVFLPEEVDEEEAYKGFCRYCEQYSGMDSQDVAAIQYARRLDPERDPQVEIVGMDD